jgi:hypothetical protein
MKIKTLIIIIFLFFASKSIAESSSINPLYENQSNEEGNGGRIYGLVESQGHSMPIGVSDLKVACGRNLINYEITLTNENGYFEFPDLSYENTGVKYYVWILPGQKVFFSGIKTIELNDENSEEYVYFFVLLKNSIIRNKIIETSWIFYWVG